MLREIWHFIFTVSLIFIFIFFRVAMLFDNYKFSLLLFLSRSSSEFNWYFVIFKSYSNFYSLNFLEKYSGMKGEIFSFKWNYSEKMSQEEVEKMLLIILIITSAFTLSYIQFKCMENVVLAIADLTLK